MVTKLVVGCHGLDLPIHLVCCCVFPRQSVVERNPRHWAENHHRGGRRPGHRKSLCDLLFHAFDLVCRHCGEDLFARPSRIDIIATESKNNRAQGHSKRTDGSSPLRDMLRERAVKSSPGLSPLRAVQEQVVAVRGRITKRSTLPGGSRSTPRRGRSLGRTRQNMALGQPRSRLRVMQVRHPCCIF